MKSNEDDKTWISNLLVRNNFLCLKQVYCCLTFVCVYRSLGNILQMLLCFPNLSTLWISHLGKEHCLLPPVLPRLSQIQRVRYDGTYNTSQKNVNPDVSGDMAVLLALSQLNQLKIFLCHLSAGKSLELSLIKWVKMSMSHFAIQT